MNLDECAAIHPTVNHRSPIHSAGTRGALQDFALNWTFAGLVTWFMKFTGGRFGSSSGPPDGVSMWVQVSIWGVVVVVWGGGGFPQQVYIRES